MEKDFEPLVGNEEIKRYFTENIRTDSFSHAYIISGEHGIGKHTLARLIAAAVNCERRKDANLGLPCHSCTSCKKILENNSADVTIIGKADKATIGIDSIRFIKNDICIAPNDGDYKIYIIEDAQDMTIQAQNALLLTLEEPPSYAMFLLLCDDTEPLLETIKSRAAMIRMSVPEKEETKKYLKKNHPSLKILSPSSYEEFEQVYKAANGRIGRILELAGDEKSRIFQNRELASYLIKACADTSLASEMPSFISLFSQKRDVISEQLTEFQSAIRDIIAIKRSDSPPLLFFTDPEYAEEISYSFSVKKLLSMLEKSELTRLSILKNANIKLALTDFLIGLL